MSEVCNRLSLLGLGSLFGPIPVEQSLASLTPSLLFFSLYVTELYVNDYSVVISFYSFCCISYFICGVRYFAVLVNLSVVLVIFCYSTVTLSFNIFCYRSHFAALSFVL